MEINNILKFITIMIVLELIMTVATPTLHTNVDEKFSIAPHCIWYCAKLCAGKLIKTPFCLVQCLFNCKDSPVISDAVRTCTATCAQHTCSKFVGSGK